MINWKDLWDDIKFEIEFYWGKVEDFFYNIYYFFRNLYLFRHDLWNYRSWDHEYCKDIYCTALEALKEEIYRDGHEVDESRLQKVSDMEELLRLLNIDEFDVLHDAYRRRGDLSAKSFNNLVDKATKAKYKRICELLKDSDGWWD